MAEGTKTLHFTKSVNIPGGRFIAGQDVPLPSELADKLLAYRTKDDEKVCVEADAPPALDRLTREALDAKATEAGVENPQALNNKSEVIAALADKGVSE